jgi:hypothetical protein
MHMGLVAKITSQRDAYVSSLFTFHAIITALALQVGQVELLALQPQ